MMVVGDRRIESVFDQQMFANVVDLDLQGGAARACRNGLGE